MRRNTITRGYKGVGSGLSADESKARANAKLASETLLKRMEAQFTAFQHRHGIDYLDARTMLLNCIGLG